MNKTPAEIVDEIEASPAFNRGVLEKNYENISVSWTLRFKSIDQVFTPPGVHRVTAVDLSGLPWVYIEVTLDRYPEFKTLKSDDRIYVSGKILRLQGYHFNLQADSIKVVNEKLEKRPSLNKVHNQEVPVTLETKLVFPKSRTWASYEIKWYVLAALSVGLFIAFLSSILIDGKVPAILKYFYSLLLEK